VKKSKRALSLPSLLITFHVSRLTPSPRSAFLHLRFLNRFIFLVRLSRFVSTSLRPDKQTVTSRRQSVLRKTFQVCGHRSALVSAVSQPRKPLVYSDCGRIKKHEAVLNKVKQERA